MTYTWADDNSTVTATRICGNVAAHVDTETVETETASSDATCTEPGTVVYTATFTNPAFAQQSKTVTGQALGHDWGEADYEWVEIANGFKVTGTVVCDRDEDHVNTETVFAILTTDTAATCDEAGLKIYTATFTKEGLSEQTKEVVVPAKEHSWGVPEWSWAEDYSWAKATFTCRNNTSHVVVLTDEEIESVTTTDDCTVGATTVYSAAVTFEDVVYRDTETVIGAATGHTIQHVEPKANSCVVDGNIEYWYCTVCHRVFLDEEATQNVSPFDVIIPVDPDAHAWGEVQYSCNDAHTKVTATRVCSNDTTHVETETVDVNYGVVTAATCEATGLGRYTGTFTKEAFGVWTEDVTIPATGHTPELVDAVAPTCVDKGNLTYVYCTVCQKLLTVGTEDVSENGWYKDTDSDKYILNEDADHHAQLVTDDAVAPTCTETGLTEGQHCARCNAITIAQTTVPALGHDYSGGVHDNENGTHSGTCVRCGALDVAEDCTYGAWEIVTGETCIAEGSRRHTCTVCGHVDYEIIGVANHDLWKTRARTAYCTQDGNIEYYTCSACHKIFRDALGTTEITAEETVIPAIGHNFTGKIHDNNNGTHSYLCVNGCGTYGAVKDDVQKPVSEGGYESHTFDKLVQTRDYLSSFANCYEPIKYFKSCECGAKSTETFTVGDALGHAWRNFPEQKATCTQAGHTAYTECERCHKQEGYELISASGHGAYNYDASKSGSSADGSIKWEAYSCEYGCGDYYMKTTITSLDANGTRVPNVNVRIVDSAGKTVASGKTDGNGDLSIGTSYKDSLHPGRYDVYLEYVRDGSNYNTHGTITFADGKVSGSFGKLTPYGGNASGSLGGKPTGEFRCSMCDLNDSMKNKPVIGWFISIIHAFVHAISRITSRR